jgi:hypothetical protein
MARLGQKLAGQGQILVHLHGFAFPQHGGRNKVVRRADRIPSQMPRQPLSVEGTTHGLTHTAVPKRLWSGLTVQNDPEVIGFQKRHVAKSNPSENSPQTPLLVQKRLHVGWMKSTDEIVFALGQAQEFGPHVLHHINVHCLQIGQWLPKESLSQKLGLRCNTKPASDSHQAKRKGPVPKGRSLKSWPELWHARHR